MNKDSFNREQFSIICKKTEQAGKLKHIGPLPVLSEWNFQPKKRSVSLAIYLSVCLCRHRRTAREVLYSTSAHYNCNGHLQEDLSVRTASLDTYNAENIYPTFHAQTAFKWVSQLNRQTDVAGLVHILICNPHVISCRTCHAHTGNPLLPSLPLSCDVWPHSSTL